MLNKRVQVLFEDKDYLTLARIARGEDLSVGELIRSAVREKLFAQQKQELKKRQTILKKHLQWRKNLPKIIKGGPVTTQEILTWVRQGRKYE